MFRTTTATPTFSVLRGHGTAAIATARDAFLVKNKSSPVRHKTRTTSTTTTTTTTTATQLTGATRTTTTTTSSSSMGSRGHRFFNRGQPRYNHNSLILAPPARDRGFATAAKDKMNKLNQKFLQAQGPGHNAYLGSQLAKYRNAHDLYHNNLGFGYNYNRDRHQSHNMDFVGYHPNFTKPGSSVPNYNPNPNNTKHVSNANQKRNHLLQKQGQRGLYNRLASEKQQKRRPSIRSLLTKHKTQLLNQNRGRNGQSSYSNQNSQNSQNSQNNQNSLNSSQTPHRQSLASVQPPFNSTPTHSFTHNLVLGVPTPNTLAPVPPGGLRRLKRLKRLNRANRLDRMHRIAKANRSDLDRANRDSRGPGSRYMHSGATTTATSGQYSDTGSNDVNQLKHILSNKNKHTSNSQNQNMHNKNMHNKSNSQDKNRNKSDNDNDGSRIRLAVDNMNNTDNLDRSANDTGSLDTQEAMGYYTGTLGSLDKHVDFASDLNRMNYHYIPGIPRPAVPSPEQQEKVLTGDEEALFVELSPYPEFDPEEEIVREIVEEETDPLEDELPPLPDPGLAPINFGYGIAAMGPYSRRPHHWKSGHSVTRASSPAYLLRIPRSTSLEANPKLARNTWRWKAYPGTRHPLR